MNICMVDQLTADICKTSDGYYLYSANIVRQVVLELMHPGPVPVTDLDGAIHGKLRLLALAAETAGQGSNDAA